MSREWKIALLVGAVAGVLYGGLALVAWSIGPEVLGVYVIAVAVLGPVGVQVLLVRARRRRLTGRRR